MNSPGIMKLLLLMTLCLNFVAIVNAQKENALIRQGNRNYEKEDFREAEKNYRKALDINNSNPKAQFNLGAAVYGNKDYEEATRIYSNMAEQKGEAGNQARVLHNLGNSLLQSREYEKSIQAYKNSLMHDPANKDTKYNLEYARMMLRKQQEQQQQNNQDKKDDKKDQQEQKKQDQQKQNQENRNQQPDQKKISKEDAERMLEALKNDEKKTQQKVKKQQAKVQVVGVEKDW